VYCPFFAPPRKKVFAEVQRLVFHAEVQRLVFHAEVQRLVFLGSCRGAAPGVPGQSYGAAANAHVAAGQRFARVSSIGALYSRY
jgi:hypothetical protein